jgi:hypothetical protein
MKKRRAWSPPFRIYLIAGSYTPRFQVVIPHSG